MTVPAHGPRVAAGGAAPHHASQAASPGYQQVHPDEYEARQLAAAAALAAQPPTTTPATPPAPAGPPSGQHLAALRAEVAAEQAEESPYLPDSILVPLRKYRRDGSIERADVVHVLNPLFWTSEANSLRMHGDFEAWAAMCLDGPDYAEVWRRVGPTLFDVDRFVFEINRVSGELGK